MITSAENKQIKRIMQLQKKSRKRGEEKVFLAEGPKMVAETPEHLLLEVYVSETFAPQWSGVVTEVVSDAVMRKVSDTKTPQGVLAIVRQPEYTLSELFDEPNPRFLVLENIQDPGNLGTMFRTAEGAGMTGVIVSADTVDLFHPKTVRATMGSLFRMPFFVADDWDQTLEALRDAGVCLYAAALQGTKSYDAFDYTTPHAFLIGNEGNGLREETIGRTDALLCIPMEGQLESLNAAMAAGILMYESYRQRRTTV